jgi:hypothetical protein
MFVKENTLTEAVFAAVFKVFARRALYAITAGLRH